MPLTRFGQATFGDDVFYGSNPADYIWGLSIDWFNDGTFSDGYNEAIHMIGLDVTRGRTNLTQLGGGGWERYVPGVAVCILDNDDGRYNPFNASGPLYGHIGPGKKARLVFRNTPSGDIEGVISGVVQDVQPFNQGARRMVRITIMDGLSTLGSTRVSKPTEPTYATVLDTVKDLLERAGWDTDEWPITKSGTSTALQYSWFTNVPTLQTINGLLDIEAGQMFHARDGSLRLIASAYDEDDNTEIDQDEILRDILIRQPWEVVRNQVSLVVYPYRGAGTAVLWQGRPRNLQDAITAWSLNPGQALTRTIQFQYDDTEFSGGIYNGPVGTLLSGLSLSPELCTDIFDATPVECAGSDISSLAGVQFTNPGDGLTFTVRNNGDPAVVGDLGYLISFVIEGVPIFSERQATITKDDVISQAQFGIKSFFLDHEFLQEYEYADAYTDWLVGALSEAQAFPTIKIQNRPELQFGSDLYVNTLNLIAPALGIDADYRIGGIRHSWLSGNGQSVQTTFTLEPKLPIFEYVTPVPEEE
jgi:hypothetical protein